MGHISVGELGRLEGDLKGSCMPVGAIHSCCKPPAAVSLQVLAWDVTAARITDCNTWKHTAEDPSSGASAAVITPRKPLLAGPTHANRVQSNADLCCVQCLRRPLWYAIVDEADAQLIDNAANPFIIATPSGVATKDATEHEAARIAVADKVTALPEQHALRSPLLAQGKLHHVLLRL